MKSIKKRDQFVFLSLFTKSALAAGASIPANVDKNQSKTVIVLNPFLLVILHAQAEHKLSLLGYLLSGNTEYI